MSGVCVTCTHPARDMIEAKIVGGVGLSALEREYALSRDALRRHRDRHLSPQVAAVAQVVREEHGKEMVLATSAKTRVEGLVAKLEALVSRTHDEKRESMLLGASRELRASIELLARLSGELRPENQQTIQILNLSTSEEWVRTRMAILGALQRHPEALIDVTTALRLLEGSEG